ncbi:MAG: hypothetical protein GF329_10800 [Candidatus Lokiarchaeota archaeon]|nr:hypothetical protein [Candidatus Lokiarchaeota archaeon]
MGYEYEMSYNIPKNDLENEIKMLLERIEMRVTELKSYITESKRINER